MSRLAVICAKNRAAVEKATERLAAGAAAAEIAHVYGVNAVGYGMTVFDEADVKRIFADIRARGYLLTTLVCNAANLGIGQKTMEVDMAEFTDVRNTNVGWNFMLAREAARQMTEAGGGSIVFITSNTAYRAIPDRVAYGASKGALLSMMRALALDLGKYNIKVNSVLHIPAVIAGPDVGNFVNHVFPFDDLAEACVLPVQVRGVRMHHEKLRGGGVRVTGARHGKYAAFVAQGILPETVGGKFPADGAGIPLLHVLVISAALQHKALDHAVEDQPVKKVLFRQRHKIGDREGCHFGVQFGFHRAIVFYLNLYNRVFHFFYLFFCKFVLTGVCARRHVPSLSHFFMRIFENFSIFQTHLAKF